MNEKYYKVSKNRLRELEATETFLYQLSEEVEGDWSEFYEVVVSLEDYEEV